MLRRSGALAVAKCFSFLNLISRGGGKVGNLILVFHFPIRRRRRNCGNVGIAPSFGGISKGLVERGGKPAFGFPGFPQPRHFHSSLCRSVFVLVPSFVSLALGLTFRQLILLGFLHPVARDVQFDDHAVMHQAVDRGRRHHRVFEDRFPF
jgi:hypothetical protein